MEEISSFTFFPSVTKRGTKKSLGEIEVSLTRARMASLLLSLLFLINIVLFLVFSLRFAVCGFRFDRIFWSFVSRRSRRSRGDLGEKFFRLRSSDFHLPLTPIPGAVPALLLISPPRSRVRDDGHIPTARAGADSSGCFLSCRWFSGRTGCLCRAPG